MERNNSCSGGFFNGFVLGFIVGAATVFLLATKKGKKLLKIITGEGLDKVSDLEELLEEKLEEPAAPKPHTNGHSKPSSSFTTVVKTVSDAATTGRRFFKGINKR